MVKWFPFTAMRAFVRARLRGVVADGEETKGGGCWDAECDKLDAIEDEWEQVIAVGKSGPSCVEASFDMTRELLVPLKLSKPVHDMVLSFVESTGRLLSVVRIAAGVSVNAALQKINTMGMAKSEEEYADFTSDVHRGILSWCDSYGLVYELKDALDEKRGGETLMDRFHKVEDALATPYPDYKPLRRIIRSLLRDPFEEGSPPELNTRQSTHVSLFMGFLLCLLVNTRDGDDETAQRRPMDAEEEDSAPVKYVSKRSQPQQRHHQLVSVGEHHFATMCSHGDFVFLVGGMNGSPSRRDCTYKGHFPLHITVLRTRSGSNDVDKAHKTIPGTKGILDGSCSVRKTNGGLFEVLVAGTTVFERKTYLLQFSIKTEGDGGLAVGTRWREFPPVPPRASVGIIDTLFFSCGGQLTWGGKTRAIDDLWVMPRAPGHEVWKAMSNIPGPIKVATDGSGDMAFVVSLEPRKDETKKIFAFDGRRGEARTPLVLKVQGDVVDIHAHGSLVCLLSNAVDGWVVTMIHRVTRDVQRVKVPWFEEGDGSVWLGSVNKKPAVLTRCLSKGVCSIRVFRCDVEDAGLADPPPDGAVGGIIGCVSSDDTVDVKTLVRLVDDARSCTTASLAPAPAPAPAPSPAPSPAPAPAPAPVPVASMLACGGEDSEDDEDDDDFGLTTKNYEQRVSVVAGNKRGRAGEEGQGGTPKVPKA
jgi:hypothetical protein